MPNMDDLEAIERFVAENDDLLKLEERIGRFNVFDALGVASAEIRHSNFLSWLLDPGESHGQGNLFLQAVLIDVLRKARAQGRPLPVSPVLLDTSELRGVQVRREWRHIDLLITCDEPRLVAAIENKVDSGEHSDQLARYESIIQSEFALYKPIFVFLTKDGEDASDKDWVAYSYADLHAVLSRVKELAKGSLGTDVLVFLDHYLNLIGTRFMDDPSIVELCKRIRSAHGRALDLIYEHTGGESEPILAAFANLIRDERPEYVVLSEGVKDVKVMPADWLPAFPPIAVGDCPAGWLSIRFVVKDQKCWFALRTSIVTDTEQRNIILSALLDPASGLGLRASFKSWQTQKRVLLLKQDVESWNEDEEPEPKAIARRAVELLPAFVARFARVPEVVASRWSP